MASSFPISGNFNFLVEIEDLGADTTSVVGGFSQASGLASESEILEFRSGADPATVKIPGRTSYSNIVLQKGVTSSIELYRWRKRVEEGEYDVRTGSIVLLDHAMNERARWNFYGGWPAGYEGPMLDSSDRSVAVESLELAVEKIERVNI